MRRVRLDRLRDLHVPLYFSEPQHLDDIPATIDKLGALLGTSNTAADAANAFRRDIARLRARYASRPAVSVFYQVWDDPLMTLNGAHVFSEVIELCGGRNVFADLKPLVPTVSTEAVLAANPEAIVTATPGATQPDHPLPALDALEAVAFDDGGRARQPVRHRRRSDQPPDAASRARRGAALRRPRSGARAAPEVITRSSARATTRRARA